MNEARNERDYAEFMSHLLNKWA